MHGRSDDKLRKKLIRQWIFTNAFHDREMLETICRVSRLNVIALMPGDELVISLVPDVEKGEVLSDGRGRGTSQMYKDQRSSRFTVVPVTSGSRGSF